MSHHPTGPTAAPAFFPYPHRTLAEAMPRTFGHCPHGEPRGEKCLDCDREHREATA
jgi:hypothetical protein